MAQFQLPKKRLVTLAVVLFLGVFNLAESCHPSSKKLHICLNIYLERDFHQIEFIVKSQQRPVPGRGGRVLLEGPDLDNICSGIVSLQNCYKKLWKECSTYWQLERYTRLMTVISSTHAHLCVNSTDNIRDLLLNSACLSRARSHIAQCSGFDWTTTWRQVLRLQMSPSDHCPVLDEYRSCITTKLRDVICGEEAARVYGALMDVWLHEWCNKNSTPESDLAYLYKPGTWTSA